MSPLLMRGFVLGVCTVGLMLMGGAGRVWAGGGDAHSRAKLLRGCGSCHVGHGKSRTKMLPDTEESFCFRCHGSAERRAKEIRDGRLANSVSLRDVSRDFRLPFRHPVGRTFGVHRKGEVLPERNARTRRHVECADCHKPHRTVRLRRTRNMTRRSPLDGRSAEYELCYRCHSDSANLPRNATNVRLAMSARNASYHPVEFAGPKGAYAPSLRAPLTVGSLISCGDCHGNDTGRGMHGSRYPFILRLHYGSSPRTPESPQAYALCYKCHDRQRLFAGRGFSKHALHVQKHNISCAVCHVAHGSPTNRHLIRFSPSATAAASDPKTRLRELLYADMGRGAGQCSVSCHAWGVNHFRVNYCEGRGPCTTTTKMRTQPLRQRRRRGSPFSF
ncbi:MAG: hypothetical protein KAI47_13375 [Deltaproteobacteria bacterium]|nr:hypothetical protein [Deltaproteobacteria bacterium]